MNTTETKVPTAAPLGHPLFTFNENQYPVRIFGTPDAPWFCAADVGTVLGLTNIRMSLDCVDPDERRVSNTYTPSGTKEITIISEAGLYRLVFKSRKPQAKRFQKWILSEVIPTLRRTGTYSIPGADALPPHNGAFERHVLAALREMREEVASRREPGPTGPRDVFPDKYHAPELQPVEIKHHLGTEGTTRARFRSWLMKRRQLSASVVEAMIDAAIFENLIEEETAGTRLYLRAVKSAA